MLKSRMYITFALLLAALFIAIVLLEQCKPHENEKQNSNEKPLPNKFLGDIACKNCHSKEFEQWKISDHFNSMQVANDSSVKGNFNDVSFTADGVSSRFYKKDGNFYINTEGPDGSNHDYKVLYTFGYKPLQQYVIAFPGGRMQIPRVSWDIKQKKWFHQYAGQKIHHEDWLHWTKGGQNWNTMCASCHSTNLQKNYFPDADSFHTTYDVINVSCETCHGPGGKHVDYTQSSEYKNGNKVPGAFLIKISDSNNLTLINTCAPCHARKSDIAQQLFPSPEFLDNYIPEIPTTEHFYADGQVNDEDYIYTSFLQSKMFSRGVSCTNCHNPHSGNLVLSGNQLCLQCHQKSYDSFSHTHHAENTIQSECISCHMPGKYYMVNDYRHDHSLRVPRPDLSVTYGTPNACNNCHNNRTSKWASESVTKWFGPTRKYHFAEDLIPGSRQDANAEPHLQKLIADTAVPAIVKAAAINYLGNLVTQSSLKTLLQNLKDPQAQIRYRALTAMSNFPVQFWKDDVGPLLSDKVRAVRIAAAQLYITIPIAQIPEMYRPAFTSAKSELENFLQYQLDFPVGNVMLADYYMKQSDFYNAERFYLRGLRMDSLMNYARLNLATAYNSTQNNKSALEVLQTAARVDPKNERIYYNLALLYVELKNNFEASVNFEKAIGLHSENPRLYYNYGLLLQQTGDLKKASVILEKGISLSPDDLDLNYAMAYLSLQSGEKNRARKSAEVLKRLDPNNPNYQQVFQALNM